MGKRKELTETKESLEVITENLSDNPRCVHGPTVLFVRGARRYYACSAYRDRKFCSFYLTEDDWLAGKKRTAEPLAFHHERMYEKLQKVTKSDAEHRRYCHTCGVPYSSTEEEHDKHKVCIKLTDDFINSPSRLLEPLEETRKEAQYFFSDESVETIVKIISDSDFRYVLCIGAPRIHERLRKDRSEKKFKSFLLDIDHRLCSFFGPDEFAPYNLFNDHFMNGKRKNFDNFMKNARGNICCIIDPPFGGRLELLKRTLHEISSSKSSSDPDELTLPILLILPYFMEPQINNYLPALKMSDYQVTYTNHQSFHAKNASPVRIFTNVPLDKIDLSSLRGYKHCTACRKWVSEWNAHCDDCNACTGKGGKAYAHCAKCARCVKATWRHCERCDRCLLSEHECGRVTLPSVRCLKCNKKGHKKNECPESQTSKSKFPRT